MKVVLGGHHSPAPDGWTVYTEEQVDITKPLPFTPGSLDIIFLEHVIEHVSFLDAVRFFEAAFTALRAGGSLQIAAPMMEPLLERPEDAYLENSIAPWYEAELKALRSLGVTPDVHQFMLHSLYTKHGHRFIWSAIQMAQVLNGIGYQAVVKSSPFLLCRRTRGGCARDPETGYVLGVKP